MAFGDGPPYPQPLNTISGSNAIGKFVIGESMIGDISPFYVWTTIISQYANSKTIAQLCTNMAQYVDPTQNFDLFFDTMFNVDTAEGYGLDVWGRIVGVTRTLTLPGAQPYFGFAEANPTSFGFGQAPFYSGEPSTANYSLTDPAFRTLILAKALANITNCSIPAINQILLNLFGSQGKCYVTDGLNMTMTYTFEFNLTLVDVAIVTQSGVLPRPSGVAATIVQLG